MTAAIQDVKYCSSQTPLQQQHNLGEVTFGWFQIVASFVFVCPIHEQRKANVGKGMQIPDQQILKFHMKTLCCRCSGPVTSSAGPAATTASCTWLTCFRNISQNFELEI
ncbi:hypothetical protein OS493_028199 [Desmophyllum pertusum]|uniref:Uncharacterized protein n=1 Tax=Desmophyllum pertusum TaxID=174260 RepID=A0A9X0CP92_9CNID|nr:hypothetical protein OS493_028199 [Desmophyllum pertusum]